MTINKNNKIEKTISTLIQNNLIPFDGLFDIDEHHLYSYIKVYNSFSFKGNSKFDYEYARKLAALSLMDIKRKRGGNSNNVNEGFVYVISNPAWDGFVKIGLTLDIHSRLSTYQTSSPHRDFKVNHYEFVLNRKKC